MPTLSEDTLILYGLTPGVTELNYVFDALREFFDVKTSKDASDRFNIILFQDFGPNYLEDFTLNSEYILTALRSLEPMLVRANIAGGIFVAVTFIIDVFKKISEKCFRLIVLTDSGSHKIPDQFIPALQNLIEKVKDIPFFIDIIRIDVDDDPKEDLKLMNLVNNCNGNVHEINDLRGLDSILEILALKREITPLSPFKKEVKEIPKEYHPFYRNLADELKKTEIAETCSICFQKDNEELVQCPRCETLSHKKCCAYWAKSSNIGISDVFRCHNCFNLVNLDKIFVEMIKYEKSLKIILGSKATEKDYIEYLKGLETELGPEIIQIEDPMALPSNYSD